MRRREFVTLLGSAMAWPLAARPQQPAMPMIGFLHSSSPGGFSQEIAGLARGLAEVGYVEGRNLAIEFRWAGDQYDRLPMLAADLIQRRVAVIIASGAVRAPLAAKAATSVIPIVFTTGSNPVEVGLVASLNHPGGNVTGVTVMARELLPKRVEVLRELLPNVSAIGLLVNPSNPNTEPNVKEAEAMARAGGWTLHVVEVRSASDLDSAFATLMQRGAGAYLPAADAIFTSHHVQMIVLAARYAMPGIDTDRVAVEAGGLISYGASRAENYRIAGAYAGRILKGEKPADLPVQQSAKVELIINMNTAKALGLTIPLTLLGRADEVIE
jgi:putative ABC transport system substrate-binding protein